jgi:hypothetical protein
VIDVSPRAWIEFTARVKRAAGHRPSRAQRPA